MKRGFTLIEMMVAVALTVLMMLLFTEIFSIATGTMSRQKGIAENDQRARTLNVLLRGDIQKRSVRDVFPCDSGESTSTAVNPLIRRGYLEISENDPNNDTDDVLQFTVDTSLGHSGANSVGNGETAFLDDTNPLYGRATFLSATTADTTNPGSVAPAIYTLLDNPNQPETDGGNVIADGSAQSPWAEVSYFMRAGNLYRRVLLIRQPLAGTTGTFDDPSAGFSTPGVPLPGGAPLFGPVGAVITTPYTGNFWTDFDFSAYYNYNGVPPFAKFNGATSLSNIPSGGAPNPNSLGIPRYRWGHFFGTGNPREFTDTTYSAFMGRYTHEETSNSNFQYPQALSLPGGFDPMDIGNPQTFTPNLAVSSFAGGPRQSQDLVLSHVHAFDIKVWDEALGGFVDIGHNTAGGDFYQNTVEPQMNRHETVGIPYGSQLLVNSRQFDTWAPNFTAPGSLVSNNTTTFDPAPFRPLRYYPIADNPQGGATAVAWQANTAYVTGNVVVPTAASGIPAAYAYYCTTNPGGTSGAIEPNWLNLNTSGALSPLDGSVTWATIGNYHYTLAAPAYPAIGTVWTPGTTYIAGSVVFPSISQAWQFGYMTLSGGTSGATEPTWPTGASSAPLSETAPAAITWNQVSNWKPLRMIQITIRYLDVPSNQMRTLTVVESLRDK